MTAGASLSGTLVIGGFQIPRVIAIEKIRLVKDRQVSRLTSAA
jgi:hypothetical protein